MLHSNRRNALAVLILGSVWITAAALIAVNDSDLSKHPVNMLFTVLVYSLPALLFGGVGFWWFGKENSKRRPNDRSLSGICGGSGRR